MTNAQPNAPYSQEAEHATIGAVLIAPHLYILLNAIIKADDFFFLRHNYIWQGIGRLHDRGDSVDNITLAKQLSDMGYLAEIGGAAYITELINSTPTSQNAEIYALLVKRTSIRRKLLQFAANTVEAATNENTNVEDVLSTVSRGLLQITGQLQDNHDVDLVDVINADYDRIERLMAGETETDGIPSGLHDLDDMLGGFQESDLVILAAPPSMGKSALILQWMLHQANAKKPDGTPYRVGFASLEMGERMVGQRLVSAHSGVDLKAIRDGRLKPEQYSKYALGAGDISSLTKNLLINDRPGSQATPEWLRAKAYEWKSTSGLDILYVDYLQKINAASRYHQMSRHEEVSVVARALKDIARELEIPVVSVATMSRAVFSRADKRPVLADLKESGDIEYEADVVMFLHRDEYWNPESTEFPNQADFIIAKHRNGPTGTVSCYFNKRNQQFKNGTTRSIDLGEPNGRY